MTPRRLSTEEWTQQFQTFEHTAFRLELQRQYTEPAERELLLRFLAGDRTPPTDVPMAREWFDLIAAHVLEGKRIERVRVHEVPPTPYQQWERWFGRWNAAAGESIHYMTRQHAHEVGLLPAAGAEDWWLFDSCRLVIMRFDDEGHRVETTLTTDPARVVQACAWRDLAMHHSRPDAADSGAGSENA